MSESAHATRILLVEDDLKLAGLVREFLQQSGLEVSVEPRGDRAAERILSERPDVVILDVMLPGLDGFSVCKRVRPQYDGGILMLTARGDEVDEVVGLELGADDYMAKPVRPRLLLARVSSLLRRLGERKRGQGGHDPTGSARGTTAQRVAVGSLCVDAGSRTAHLDGEPVELTTAEFDLLWLLARHAGEVLSREQIYAELRGIEYDGLDRSVDLRIARLRKKIGDDGKSPQKIKSVRGAGYLLVADP